MNYQAWRKTLQPAEQKLLDRLMDNRRYSLPNLVIEVKPAERASRRAEKMCVWLDNNVGELEWYNCTLNEDEYGVIGFHRDHELEAVQFKLLFGER